MSATILWLGLILFLIVVGGVLRTVLQRQWHSLGIRQSNTSLCGARRFSGWAVRLGSPRWEQRANQIGRDRRGQS